MKHMYELEPRLRYALSEKRAKRMSHKWVKRFVNRAFRRLSKMNLFNDNFATNLFKKSNGYEY